MTTGAGRLSLNVVLNTLGTLLNALTGFVTLPFLVWHLGHDGYGFWTLIVATTGYFLVLDFGVSGALGRIIAGRRAQDDIDGINRVLSTTFLLLLGIGSAVAVATLFVPTMFMAVFEVPAERSADVAAALLVVGFTSALYFPAAPFHGFLWGHERFDLYNFVEIPMLVGRAATILLVVHQGSSLFELALIVSGWTVAAYIVRAALCWRVDPRIRLSLTHWTPRIIGEVYSFGVWFGLLVFIRQSLPTVATFVIGYGLGPVAVTTFTIPRLLASYSNWFLVSATQVAAPRAALFHYGDKAEEQRALLLEGGRYAYALSLFFVVGLIVLGAPLLRVWQPASGELEYTVLVILMLGELLPMSQWITYNAIVGVGRHRRLVVYGAIEIAAIVALSALVMPYFGLIGIAVVVATSGFLMRGVLQLFHGCRVVEVSAFEYLVRVYMRTSLVALVPVAMLTSLAVWLQPEGWFGVLATGTVFATIYWGIMLPYLLGRERTRAVMAAFRAQVAGRPTGRAASGTPAAPGR